MKTLKELLAGVSFSGKIGDEAGRVNAVHFDSRKVGQGDLFVAQRGVSVDGHALSIKRWLPELLP